MITTQDNDKTLAKAEQRLKEIKEKLALLALGSQVAELREKAANKS